MSQFEDKIILKDIGQAQQIGGLADENIRAIEKRTGARIVARGQDILLGGSQGSVQAARIVLELSLIHISGIVKLLSAVGEPQPNSASWGKAFAVARMESGNIANMAASAAAIYFICGYFGAS